MYHDEHSSNDSSDRGIDYSDQGKTEKAKGGKVICRDQREAKTGRKIPMMNWRKSASCLLMPGLTFRLLMPKLTSAKSVLIAAFKKPKLWLPGLIVMICLFRLAKAEARSLLNMSVGHADQTLLQLLQSVRIVAQHWSGQHDTG